jgi:hypothetical protein
MTMELTLTAVLLVFLTGFLISRHRSVLVAALAAFVLGALLANGWLGDVVHTLDGVFSSVT